MAGQFYFLELPESSIQNLASGFMFLVYPEDCLAGLPPSERPPAIRRAGIHPGGPSSI